MGIGLATGAATGDWNRGLGGAILGPMGAAFPEQAAGFSVGGIPGLIDPKRGLGFAAGGPLGVIDPNRGFGFAMGGIPGALGGPERAFGALGSGIPGFISKDPLFIQHAFQSIPPQIRIPIEVALRIFGGF